MAGSAVTAAASREFTDAERSAVRAELEALSAEAFDFLYRPEAAPLHCALGRIYLERLGDPRSAAICLQNAFQIDPTYRPAIEAARQIFQANGRLDRALALHEREEALITSPPERAESLRAQAAILAQEGNTAEAARRIEQALQIVPDHPALLASAAEAARGDGATAGQFLLRMAELVQDQVQKRHFLSRALGALEPLAARPDVQPLLDDAVRQLHEADPNDPAVNLALLQRALAANDWAAVLHLWRARAARTSVAADRVAVAHLVAWRLRDPATALAELRATAEGEHDQAALALGAAIAEDQPSPDLLELLRARAAGSADASERADLKVFASMLVSDAVEQERLLSEALTDSPGDAAAIALHARLVARRDAFAAAERFVALGDALAEHLPASAAARYVDAAAALE
ncbi:MAG TPA: hypothetical protein VG496_17665, partial [Myxococcales bacterium]|nr:hypothetical protein [Myxococcales bacterium]